MAAVLAAVLVVGAGIAAWQLWPEGKDSSADPTSTPTTKPASEPCWDPDITSDCPQFTGRDAALYVFSLKDDLDEDSCERSTDHEQWGSIGAVDYYFCRFSDLGTRATILQWPTAAETKDAWLYRPTEPTEPWFEVEARWAVDGEEMGDQLVLADPTAAAGDSHVRCYDDLPFCLFMLGDTGKADTGAKGDWTLTRDKFDWLDAEEVADLKTFLADNPSMVTGPAPPPNDHEITDLSSVERSVQGQLAKGYCFDNNTVDLADALNKPTTVETIPCTDPHPSQVIGFIDISDVGSGEDFDSQNRYALRCRGLMSAENVPEALQAHSTYHYPTPQEVEAGVRVAMCLVHTDTPWTGSALDGTAAGF